MNWDQVEGKWKQYSGKAKEKWGKLTDDDLEVIRGRRDQLIGKIQERYGIRIRRKTFPHVEQRRSAGPVRPDSIESDHCMGDEGAILPGNRVWLPPLSRILSSRWPASAWRSAFSRNHGVLLG